MVMDELWIDLMFVLSIVIIIICEIDVMSNKILCCTVKYLFFFTGNNTSTQIEEVSNRLGN